MKKKDCISIAQPTNDDFFRGREQKATWDLSHLCFENLRIVVIDTFHPLPRRQHGAASVDGAREIGFSNVPVTAADDVGVAVVGFLVDETCCLWVAGTRLFATCDSGGGEEGEEQC